jgi:2-polyprenyl-3-methyl-5-hydroxy-6-metoxy-1,4-benzoquinol methylase
MEENENIKKSIDDLIKALNNFKKVIEEKNTKETLKEKLEKTVEESLEENIDAIYKIDEIDPDDFNYLKNALLSENWPEAVHPNLICRPDSEEDKLERGMGIIELMVEEDLENLKLLDFGCGEGQCSLAATDFNPNLVVGYDIKKFDSWNNYSKEKLLYTTDFNEVLNNGPYDVIVLFDVIDHPEKESPKSILGKVYQALSDNGKVYMRCHPFTSRHATHLYHDLNKSYIHLVFTPEEIKKIIPESKYEEKNVGITKPLISYQEMIDSANFKIVTKREITSKVEPIFKIPKIERRINQITKFDKLPEFQMSMDFLDYVLKK